jgi:hypothetical protein
MAGSGSTQGSTSRFVSTRQAAFIGVGAMVGAGIFSLLGAAGEVAGAAVWLSFLLAGIIASLQGYSFAKLGARYPTAAGLLEYVNRGFGVGHIATVTAWLTYAANGIVTAMVAVSFGSYASGAFTGGDAGWAKAFAVTVVVVMTALNVAGSTLVARVQSLIVFVVVGILGLFALVTIANVDPDLLAPSGYPSARDIVSSVVSPSSHSSGSAWSRSPRRTSGTGAPAAPRDGDRDRARVRDLRRGRDRGVQDAHRGRGGRGGSDNHRRSGQARPRRRGLLAHERDRAVRDGRCSQREAISGGGVVRAARIHGPVPDGDGQPDRGPCERRPARGGRRNPGHGARVRPVGHRLHRSAVALTIFALVTAGHLRVRSETGANVGILVLRS